MKKYCFIIFFLFLSFSIAKAQIIYKSFTNLTAYLNQSSKYVDIDNDSINDMGFFSQTIPTTAHNWLDVNFLTTPNHTVACTNNPVSCGTLINSSLQFRYFTTGTGGPYSDGNIYIPFRFISEGDSLYGYFYFTVSGNTITLNYYAYNSIPGQSIIAGEAIPEVCSNLVVNDISNNYNGSDLKLNFNFPQDTTNNAEYRVFLVNVNNTSVFDLNDALNVPDSLSYFFTNNSLDSIIFQNNSRSIDGNYINAGPAYRAYIMTNTRDSMSFLSFPSNQLRLSWPLNVESESVINFVLVYPNPANQFIYVDVRNDSPYKLYNTQGQLVLAGFVKNNVINLEGLNSGMYILQTFEEGAVYTAKVVKE